MRNCVLTQHFKMNTRNYFHLFILRNTRMHVWKRKVCLCPERDLQFFLVWSKQWSSYLRSDRTPWMSLLWNIRNRITRGSSRLNRKKKLWWDWDCSGSRIQQNDNMTASHRSVSYTSMMGISCSATFRGRSTGLRSGNCESNLSTWNSSSCLRSWRTWSAAVIM